MKMWLASLVAASGVALAHKAYPAPEAPLCPAPLPPANALRAMWGASSSDLWAAGDSGTIVHSLDGKTWAPVATGSRAPLVALWSQGGAILAAGGDTLLRSVDKGKTWTQTKIGPDAKILAAWGQGTAIFAAGEGGQLFRSLDVGQSFQALATPTKKTLRAIWGRPSARGKDAIDLFASGDGATVICSPDLGATWLPEKIPAVDPSTSFTAIAGDDREVWVTSSGSETLLRKPTGAAWEDRTQTMQTCGLDDEGGGLDHVSLAEIDRHLWFTAWTQFSPGMMHFDELGFIGHIDDDLKSCAAKGRRFQAPDALWIADKSVFVAGEQGYLARTDDNGDSWHDFAEPDAPFEQDTIADCLTPAPAAIWGLGKDDVYVAAARGQILHSADQGVSWQRIATPTNQSLTAIAGEPKHIVAVGGNGAVLISRDGVKFEAAKSQLSAPLASIWVRGKSLRAASDKAIFVSDDDGASWKQRPVPGDGVTGVTWVSPTEAWAGTTSILHTTDTGATWTSVFPIDQEVYGFLPLRDRIYAFGGENPEGTYLLVSTDKGESWTPVEVRIGNPISSAWASADGKEIWLTGSRGLAHSTDGGKTWQTEDVAIGFGAVWGDDAGDVFITTSHGVLRR
jgi:photosystem II stability/assembly factor-like uncharacterized protein